MMRKWITDKNMLALILVIAACLRFYKIGSQSFWLDELHTVIELDPALGWADMFGYLKCCDPHPPLFFILEKLVISLFGSTEFVVRSLTAIAGVAGVWTIYLLGRELHSSRLGLIAATLCCFNYFHILHSQDARPYSLAFLFACLSFLYLARLIKNPSWKNTFLYSLWASAMMYTHYFGLFVFVSQGTILLLFAFYQQDNFKKYLKHGFVSMLLVLIAYTPWVPYLVSMTERKKFWIPPIPGTFAVDFFYEFFGNSDILKPFLLLLLTMGLLHFLWVKKAVSNGIKTDSFRFGFIIYFLWITITYLIPYIRSILVVPMLYPRYAIVVLPAFLLILSVGIASISHRIPKILLLATFCVLSVFDIAILKKHYSGIHKTQFREMAAFIASEKNFSYPVLSDATAWHQQYYLKKMKYKQPILTGSLDSQLDSVFNNKDKNNGFWISGAHQSEKPGVEKLKLLDSLFILFKQQSFFDAWAHLYIPRHKAGNDLMMLDYKSFASQKPFIFYGDSVVPIWEREIRSDTVSFKKGTHNIQVQMAGTAASNIFPHIKVLLNNAPIGNFYVSEALKYYDLPFNCTSDLRAAIHIVMENDTSLVGKGEDRNAFVKSIIISTGNDK